MAGQRRASRNRAQTQEILGEAEASVGDSSTRERIAGGLLASVAVGAVLSITTLRVPLHATAGTMVYLGLLALVIISLVGSAVMLMLARQPVIDARGELRRLTGTPVERTPWTPVQQPLYVSDDAARDLLFDAVSLRNQRVGQALIWVAVTFAGFLAWTVAALVVAGRI
jgi:hypothetical protein